MEQEDQSISHKNSRDRKKLLTSPRRSGTVTLLRVAEKSYPTIVGQLQNGMDIFSVREYGGLCI
jgi:hypothetical protein